MAVIGLPDAERGERVCAVLVLRPGATAPSLGEVASYLRDAGIMAQKLPEQLEVIDQMPVTGLGKLNKISLRDQLSHSLRCHARRSA